METAYEFIPIDTLFFRGAIPMDAGLPVSDALFPPPVSVITGAVLTASGQDYWNDAARNNLFVRAILLKQDGTYFAQAPYSWFESKDDKQLYKAYDNNKKLFEEEGAVCSVEQVPWVDCKDDKGNYKDVKSIGGRWIKLNLKTGFDIDLSKQGNQLFAPENRTGVALDQDKRTAIEKQLYTAQHIRLHDGVSIVVVLEGNHNLQDNGILQLGGERRLCRYRKIENFNFPDGQSKYYVTLAPLRCTTELLEKVFCAKTYITSGWDLDKNSHKETVTWFCAGSVFNEDIKEIQCLPLAEKENSYENR